MLLVAAARAAGRSPGLATVLAPCGGRLLLSTAAGAQGVEALPLPGAHGDATLLRLPQRPFGAAAELPESVISAAQVTTGTTRVAVVRPAFAPCDEPQPALASLVAPLGRGAVALAAATQRPSGRVVVDEYARAGPGAPFSLKAVSTELADYLARSGVRAALVPDVAAAARGGGELTTAAASAAAGGPRQSTNRCLMVAPTAFEYNAQAAQDNSFMSAEKGSGVTATVLREYAALHTALTDAGVDVSLFAHDRAHGTPDACFPNNWFSTHAAAEGGSGRGQRTLVLYPMKCPNRAAERRPDVIAALKRAGGYSHVHDMSAHEARGKYFEGTGVLVLDRVNGVAYVDLSERADEALAREWCEALGYGRLVAFRAHSRAGAPVYHTNVMMAVGSSVAVVCAESVTDAAERRRLLDSLTATHEVVQITHAQMDALCANCIELLDGRGLPVLAMSTRAHDAFTAEQRRTLERHVARLVHAPIDTLERIGGGGVRCTIAELF